MQTEGHSWPVRRRMPDLAALSEPTREIVHQAVVRLRASGDFFANRFLGLVRDQLPDYGVLSDDEIRITAQRFMDTLISELSSLRVPDDALREMLTDFALERAAQGLPLDILAIGYQLGSREMLNLLDEVAAEVALPSDLVLAIHDSTWEFSNEASSIFARIRHDLELERARFDAERRSAFAGGVLSGALPADQIHCDAQLFGLDPQALHTPVAARAASTGDADAIRRAIAATLRLPADRLLFAELGKNLGVIAPSAPESLTGHLVALGPALPLDELQHGFDEAVLALKTAQRFGLSGVVRLSDLGPRPLILAAERTATSLATKHLQALDSAGRSTREIEETTRVYLECNQQVAATAELLAVHENTVRYRVSRFHQLTGLDLRCTEDLVTTWWLLNRRHNT
ncbi:PucR family transcriptional regulator [Kribbella antibiotica]|uniref:PucR family transcriptional regulator n=1 Tax=Kribbella antibiotica TaxID=190195 RepID=A0A4R4ZUL9_9ACTN|nr:helix-turn-helix domain-containing protein [Kribbella antibiotica]TDD61679.1 PucR family transcriptional regulator [Kribbella antibiotica]